jgi:hypothetical protein
MAKKKGKKGGKRRLVVRADGTIVISSRALQGVLRRDRALYAEASRKKPNVSKLRDILSAIERLEFLTRCQKTMTITF